MNTAQLTKSERRGARISDICATNLLWLQQALSFMRGFCISRASVPKEVNRHTNLNYS